MYMKYPRRRELACRFHVPVRLLSALFCPATAAVCLGKTFWDSKLTAWIRLHRAPTRWHGCVQEQSALPRRLSLPGLIVMTFQKSSRRRPNPRNPQTLLLVRPETSSCRVLQIPSRPRGVTPVRKRRFTALYWPSNGVSLQKRRPKASTDDRPSTRTLLFSFLFDSRALIATLRHIASTTQTALCPVHTWPLAIAIDDPDPVQPVRRPFSSPPISDLGIPVRVSQKNACQTHFLSIHLWENKPRWEKPKKKKKKT